jgi:hypothetical protein
MFQDEGGGAGTTLEVLSYFLRKRYAVLLNTVNTTPGYVANTGEGAIDGTFSSIGTATDRIRTQGSNTEPDDNTPTGGAEPDTSFYTDATSYTEQTETFYQCVSHTTAWGATEQATMNNMGLLYWTSPDLKIGPHVEADMVDTLANHCLTQMLSGDEVGSYRVATSAPNTASGVSGGWVDKGDFFIDGIYNDASFGTYKLWLKTANTTEPSTPDNYVRWDSTNNEIQLESSVDYSATAKLINDAYLTIIKRRHLLYNVATSNSSFTNRGTFYDKVYDASTNVLSGPSGGVYTRTWTPTGSATDNSGPYYFISPGQRTP